MMPIEIEALKLANDVMKAACKQIDELKAENKALKEALAVDKESLTTETQPEQEPVKIAYRHGDSTR
jgi:cell shape-determining protein MreC